MGDSGIVDSIADKMSHYSSTVPKSATFAMCTYVHMGPICKGITFLSQN